MTDFAAHEVRSPDPAGSAGGPAFESRLVERALGTAGPTNADRIHLWGQYHRSRLAPHVLAYLAHPGDPGAVLDAGRHKARLRKAALNLEALCALAAGLGLKARTRQERAAALDLFDLARERLGDRLPAQHQELHATLAHLNGRRRAAALAEGCDGAPPYLAEAFRCQDAHPRNGGSPETFKRRFAAFAGLPELRAPHGSVPSLDELRTAPVPPVDKGPLISVVMTCHRPGPALLTAVRSVVAQSWQRWELLLVDDASGPEYAPVLNEALALDPRVELLVQPENAGTYQARNRAMAVAEGAFVTGLDSDDWAHPLRLERQVAPLLAQPSLAMVESSCLAVRDDLSLVIDPQVALIAARSTPIMIRAEAMRLIGFYDEVRKTADSEYRYRLKAALGRKASVRATCGPLTLVRHAATTLSAGEVSRHWMSAARLAYHCGFTHWHRRIAADEAEPALPAIARPRPFPISRDLTRTNAQNAAIAYHRIYAADWRSVDRRRRSMLEDAAREARKGRAVGLLHCPEWVQVDGKRPLINQAVLEAAAEHGLDFLDFDRRHTAPVIVPTEAYAELLLFEHPGLPASRVRVQPAAPEPAAPPPIPAQDPPPRPARRALPRRDALALAGGLCSAAAATALTAVAAPASLAWAAAGGLAVWGGLAVALTARRLGPRPARR